MLELKGSTMDAMNSAPTELAKIALADIPTSETEEVASTPRYTCTECGVDITSTYSGKGRPPTKCAEHKKKSGASTLGRKTGSGEVGKAVTALDDAYQLVALLLLPFAPNAADDLKESLPSLREKNAQYLQHDPKLVKAINRVGATGGRSMFVLSNAMVLIPVAVTASTEIREKYAAAREAAEQSVDEAATFPGFADVE